MIVFITGIACRLRYICVLTRTKINSLKKEVSEESCIGMLKRKKDRHANECGLVCA